MANHGQGCLTFSHSTSISGTISGTRATLAGDRLYRQRWIGVSLVVCGPVCVRVWLVSFWKDHAYFWYMYTNAVVGTSLASPSCLS
jgi:hypothetical protein